MLNFFKKKTKVYCRDCEYLKSQEDYFGRTACTHPKNIVNSSDWYKPFKQQKRWPKQINKRNNCKWFEAKTENTVF